jgi:hypothetical protein
MEEASNPEEDRDWIGGRSRGTSIFPPSHSIIRVALRLAQVKNRKENLPIQTYFNWCSQNENAGISSSELVKMKKILDVEERLGSHPIPFPPT